MQKDIGTAEQSDGLPRAPFRWEDPRIYAAHLAAHYQHVRRGGTLDIEQAAAGFLELVGVAAEDPLCVAAVSVARVARTRPFEQVTLLTDATSSLALMLSQVQPPEYHNPFHALEVACNVGILLAIGGDVSPRYGALTLVAALGHDLCHDGTSNLRPFHLEERAVQAVRSLANQAGVSMEEQSRIEALIFATDVASARPTVAALASGQLPPQPVPLELTEVVEDAELARAAAVIVDADVLCSAGLTWEMHRFQSEALGREWNREMGARDAVYFLDTVLGGRFLSVGGRYFMPNLESNLRRAREEIAGPL